MIDLALAQAATGEADAALKTLADIEQKFSYVEDQAGFYIAKTYVLQKKGDRGEASRAWQQARRMNPRARRFRE